MNGHWSPGHDFLELAGTELEPAPQETVGSSRAGCGKAPRNPPLPGSLPQPGVHSHGRVLGACDVPAASLVAGE